MLALDLAGARHSQSPVTADKGTVMEQHAPPGSNGSGQYCSPSKTIQGDNAPHAGTGSADGGRQRPPGSPTHDRVRRSAPLTIHMTAWRRSRWHRKSSRQSQAEGDGVTPAGFFCIRHRATLGRPVRWPGSPATMTARKIRTHGRPPKPAAMAW